MWAYEGVSASSRHVLPLLEPSSVGREGSTRVCSQAGGAAARAVSGLQGAVLLPDGGVAVVVVRRDRSIQETAGRQWYLHGGDRVRWIGSG
jgi:hypothetical protein